MTRAQAHQILTLWKLGTWYPSETINLALYATGDLA